MTIGKKFVVVTGSRVGSNEEIKEIPLRVDVKDGVYAVYIEEADGVSPYNIVSNWRPGQLCLRATINGAHKITAQVERKGIKLALVLDGAHYECMVLSPLGAELQRRMLVKVPPDTSKFVMSPMPGLLTNISVKVGEVVTAGQKLAAIEAMKMENTLLAAQDGVVAEICANVGESLAVDQLIIRFE
jgi:propionyl-CoA carboxylase alpha chain